MATVLGRAKEEMTAANQLYAEVRKKETLSSQRLVESSDKVNKVAIPLNKLMNKLGSVRNKLVAHRPLGQTSAAAKLQRCSSLVQEAARSIASHSTAA